MTDYLIFLVDRLLPVETYSITIGTPRDRILRGGHVALEGTDDMWRLYLALKAKGVVPDFRAPNIIRIAPIALYNSYHDVWQTVQWLKEIIDNKEYEAFSPKRAAVT
jgi:kynureninase